MFDMRHVWRALSSIIILVVIIGIKGLVVSHGFPLLTGDIRSALLIYNDTKNMSFNI
jgi:hypothetical protein